MKILHKHTHMVGRLPAFTLTELLVSIAIVVILVTLSLTGFTRMRQAGDMAACSRNISQLQIANMGYANDHNGQFVPIYAFDDKGGSYVAWCQNPDYLSHLKGESAVYLDNGKIDKTVPLNMLDPVAVRSKKKDYNNIQASFGYNTNGVPGSGWGQPNAAPCYRIHQLTAPARSAVFITATDWNVRYASRFLWQGTAAVEGKSVDQKMAYRHGNKALVVFYDGHIGNVTVDDIKKIDAEGGANHPFWKGDAQ